MPIRLSIDGAGTARAVEMATRPLGPRSVRLAVDAVGVCGTDLLALAHGADPQATLGHEIVATVTETSGDLPWTRGSRVMVRPTQPCHDCWYCTHGLVAQCDQASATTLSTGLPGGFADELVIDDPDPDRLVAVADGVPVADALWAEPLAVALRIVDRGGQGRTPGRCIVVGSGPLGLCTVAAATAAGWDCDVLEPQTSRREAALRAGAVRALATAASDCARSSVVLVTAGSPAAVALAREVVLPGGTVVMAGLGAASVPGSRLDHVVRGSLAYAPPQFASAAALVNSGRVQLGYAVTHRRGLREAGDLLELSRQPDTIKIAITPGAGGASTG